MPKNVIITNRADLESVAVPADVVSHKYVMDEIVKELAANNITVKKEIFQRNINGEIATGIYVLDYAGADPEVDAIISWTNTYDRTMKFKCVVGGYIKDADAYIVANDSSSVKVNNLDKSDVKALTIIKAQVSDIQAQYAEVIKELPDMKDVDMTDEELSHLGGSLYFNDTISSSQLIKIKESTKKSSRTLYALYGKIANTLVGSHPKSWATQQVTLHSAVLDFKARLELASTVQEEEAVEEVDPNQTSLLDEIESNTDIAAIESTGPLSLDDFGDKVEEVELPVEQTMSVNTPDAVDLLSEAPDENEDLTKTDADEGPDLDNKVQDPEALTLEAHDPFPAPPATMPVSSSPAYNKAMEEIPEEIQEEVKADIEAIPLEDQIAGEEVAPVSEAEIEVSAPPIVDEPVLVDNDAVEFNPQPVKEEVPEQDLDWVDEGPVDAPEFTPEDNSKETLESPFEF